MNKQFQLTHAFHNPVRRRRHKNGIAGLVPPIQFWLVRNSPGFLPSPRPFLSKTSVHLPDQPQRQGQAFPDLVQAVLHGGNVIADFRDIFQGNAGNPIHFRHQQVRQ